MQKITTFLTFNNQAKEAAKRIPSPTHFKTEDERRGAALRELRPDISMEIEERRGGRSRPRELARPSLGTYVNPYQAPAESLIIAELP